MSSMWPVMRLKCMNARRRVNFNLVRLLIVVVYIIGMFFVVANYIGSEPEPEENAFTGAVDSLVGDVRGRDPAKFVVVGQSSVDFRQYPNEQDESLPEAVKQFEAGFKDKLGDGGNGVHLSGDEKTKADEIQKKWAFNKVASDKISLWRTLTDKRMAACASLSYSPNLPSSSVIIIFNNEALSALLRTVWSVLDRTPSNLLHEIILVDDASNQTEITDILPDYIKHRLPPKVGMVRTESQLGLIRARLAGAKVASGDILVFLDSHCEATKGWIEPMAKRIKEDRTVVQIPMIEGIDATTISYHGGGGGSTPSVGGFTWSGHFTWESLPRAVQMSRKPTDPARTATMAGGLFAVHRDYFWEIGGYDEGMSGWGGENLELSFRVWRCGGSMEIHPCSHVGHIFRPFHPYFIPEDSHGINSARMAEVWMDDLKRLYYMHRQDLLGKNIGDLSDRFAIIDRLKCKSFHWFLENVYPHKYILDEQALAWGRVRNKANGREICFDHLQRDQAAKLVSYTLGEYPCHGVLGDSQYFTLSKQGELRNEYMCADVSNKVDPTGKKNRVKMVGCSDSTISPKWEIDRLGHIRNLKYNLCVDSGKLEAGAELELVECATEPTQVWVFEFYAEGSEHLKPGTP